MKEYEQVRIGRNQKADRAGFKKETGEKRSRQKQEWKIESDNNVDGVHEECMSHTGRATEMMSIMKRR